MSRINADKGVDILLEILRQSKAIKANLSKNQDKNPVDAKKVDDGIARSPRSSLRRTDTDKDILMSRKERYNYQRKNEEEYKIIKDMIEGILNRMTARDYMKLSEEGFNAEDLTIEALTFAVELIKDYEDGKDIVKEKSSDHKKEGKKSLDKISTDDIKKAMEEENLPVNNDSVEKIKTALHLSEGIPHMDKKDILYILKNGLDPSIENLYKARFSKQGNEATEILSDEEWEKLIPQVKEIIDYTKAADNKELLKDARWLIENDIALTDDNLSLLVGFEDLKKNYSIDMIFDRIFKGMKEGNLPGEAILIEKDNPKADIIPQEDISLKRQLEETRLKMTLEAAMLLEKKGIHIDTDTLERVVEKLRLEEEAYFREHYSQEIAEAEESLRLLQLTSESMDELKAMPIQVLGATLESRRTQTVSGLLETGRDIIADLDKAKEAYETFFTIPRAEYGDSIKKAFANASSLLDEMGIENTEYNQRAIRILGYNRMEITKEAIEQVKAYDLSVNYLMKNLNPAAAVQLIKEGVNPLNMPIDELNSRIEELNEQGYSSLEKYSSYLYRLEKEEGISEDERRAYIGIYRLLYQIEKSDGAALGAVIKSEQEVTLNHLLTALRTNKRGTVDYRINDDFGALEELSVKGESISDQLRAVFDATDDRLNGQNMYEAGEEIQKALVKELLNTLTPDKLHQLHNSIPGETGASAGKPSAHINVWETIGNLTIEQLLEQTKNMESTPAEDQAYYYEKLKDMQEVYNNCDRAIRFLNDFQLPCTTSNLMMAGQIIHNSGTVFKRIFGLTQDKEDEKPENSQNSLKKKLELSDKLIDNESMTKAYEQLEQEVKAVIEDKALEEQIDSKKLAQLKSMGMQMSFLRNLATREFYHIPIEVSGRITNINLTIIRGREAGGRVTVSLESDKLGSIKAEASLKDKKLNAYIACDHIGSLKILESQTEPVKSVAQEENIAIKQFNFCPQQASDTTYTYQNTQGKEGDKNPETERILYRLAKAMIHMIRQAEEADTAVA
jgi:hypothetical protein